MTLLTFFFFTLLNTRSNSAIGIIKTTIINKQNSFRRPFQIPVYRNIHQASEQQNKPRSLCNPYYDSDVLIVGDGDLGFSAALANLGICKSLTTSTLDTPTVLMNSFIDAGRNIDIIQSKGGEVKYEIDATKIPFLEAFDIISWNFPHIAGKSNTKYNRELIYSYFSSAKLAIRSNGSVILSLCSGQSGTEAVKVDDWNYSWKLIEQAGEAGLLLVDIIPFNIDLFEGYKPKGHRGHGGPFHVGNDPKIYIFKLPGFGRVALQAQIFTHEVHMLSDKIFDFSSFEEHVQNITFGVGNDFNFKDFLYAVKLVDIYPSPGGQNVSYAFQVTYCSQTQCLSRMQANTYKEILDIEIPKRMNLKPRPEKHVGSVSKCYPWFVTKSMISQTCAYSNTSNGTLYSEEDSIQRDSIRLTARSLWTQRMAVLTGSTKK